MSVKRYERILKMRFILCIVFLTAMYSCRSTSNSENSNFIRAQYLYDATANKSLDVIYKKDAHKLPVLVYIHGGAWCKDSKNEWSDKAGRFLLDNDIISVSIDYTLAPEQQYTQDTIKGVYPVIMDNVAYAVQWVRKNIPRFGGDPDCIFIMGFSAGNLLADLVVLQNRISNMQNCIKGVINLDAGPYITKNDKLMAQLGITPLWINAFGSRNYNNNALNPEQLIPQHSWLPPFLLIHQDIDVRLIPNHDFAKTLRANRHICNEIIVNVMPHDNFPHFVELNLPFSSEIINFIKKYSIEDDA